MRTHESGFALMEMLAALALLSIVMAGVVATFFAQSRSQVHQDLGLAVEQELRLAMTVVSDVLRNAGHGVPTERLVTWTPWVGGLTANPQVTDDGVHDTISIAGCTTRPVATLAALASQGATTLTVQEAVSGVVDTGSKRLILVDGEEHAHVTSVSGASMTIDTNPVLPGAQGLRRAHPIGSPICRVDVTTFVVEVVPAPHLTMDEHQGMGPMAVVDNIHELDVDVVGPDVYALTLMGRSITPDPATGTHIVRRLRRIVALRN